MCKYKVGHATSFNEINHNVRQVVEASDCCPINQLALNGPAVGEKAEDDLEVTVFTAVLTVHMFLSSVLPSWDSGRR